MRGGECLGGGLWVHPIVFLQCSYSIPIFILYSSYIRLIFVLYSSYIKPSKSEVFIGLYGREFLGRAFGGVGGWGLMKKPLKRDFYGLLYGRGQSKEAE